MSTLPPRPRLVLRAGFAGRKELTPDEQSRLGTALQEVLTTVGQKLAALAVGVPVEAALKPSVASYFAETPPLLRLITGLCEGADALAAKVLEDVKICPDNGDPEVRCLDKELAAVLPFAVETYRRSRPAAFHEEFDRQLAQCAWVLALDGLFEKPDPDRVEAKNRRSRAYRAQSAFLLRQSDLLIAAADPSDTAKAGGTLETVREALFFELPVVFIHTGTGRIYIISPGEDLHAVLAGDTGENGGWQEMLRKVIGQLTVDPDSGLTADEHHDAETRHATESLLKEFFTDDQCPERQSAHFFIRARKAVWDWFESRFRTGPGPARDPQLAPYASYRNRATELNYHYSGIYRGAFLLNYVMAITAVALAALSLALLVHSKGAEWVHPVLLVLTGLKLFIVLLIAHNTKQANEEKWNERAVSYRYLAERLRGMYYLPQIGSQQPPAASPQHFASRAVHQSVVDWLFDAITRSISVAELKDIVDKEKNGDVKVIFSAPKPATLPTHDGSGKLTVKSLFSPQPLQVMQNVRDRWIKEQVKYHAREARTKHALHHFLETASVWLGWAVICIVLADLGIVTSELHALPQWLGATEWLEKGKDATPWLIFVSAVLPAVIAAFGGIRFQSECQRLAERSGVMRVMLAGQEPRKPKTKLSWWSRQWRRFVQFWSNLWVILRHLFGCPPSPPDTPTQGGHCGLAQKLADRIALKTAEPATDPGSWAHQVLRLTENTATVFVHEAAEWSVLYAKDVADPG